MNIVKMKNFIGVLIMVTIMLLGREKDDLLNLKLEKREVMNQEEARFIEDIFIANEKNIYYYLLDRDLKFPFVGQSFEEGNIFMMPDNIEAVSEIYNDSIICIAKNKKIYLCDSEGRIKKEIKSMQGMLKSFYMNYKLYCEKDDGIYEINVEKDSSKLILSENYEKIFPTKGDIYYKSIEDKAIWKYNTDSKEKTKVVVLENTIELNKEQSINKFIAIDDKIFFTVRDDHRNLLKMYDIKSKITTSIAEEKFIVHEELPICDEYIVVSMMDKTMETIGLWERGIYKISLKDGSINRLLAEDSQTIVFINGRIGILNESRYWIFYDLNGKQIAKIRCY